MFLLKELPVGWEVSISRTLLHKEASVRGEAQEMRLTDLG